MSIVHYRVGTYFHNIDNGKDTSAILLYFKDKSQMPLLSIFLKIKVSGILEYGKIKIAVMSLPLSILSVFVKMAHLQWTIDYFYLN